MRTKKTPTPTDLGDLAALREVARLMREAPRTRDALIWRLRDSGVSPEDIAEAAGLTEQGMYKVPRP